MFFGGTFIYHFYPKRLVFIDGRTCFPEWFTEGVYGKVKRAEPRWEEILDRYNVNTLLLHSYRFPMIHRAFFHSPDWILVYRDEIATLYVRKTKILKNR
jgi:hypothetical protein